jgi:hypothetical protein
MVRGFLLPGLGQFYTQRPVLGGAFLATGVGVLAASLIASRRNVECLARMPDNSCPSDQERDSRLSQPLFPVGIAGFVVAAVASGFEARSAARRLNRQASPTSSGDQARRSFDLAPAIEATSAGLVRMQIVRLHW